MRLKLFSWNINGLRAVLRKNALQTFLGTYHPNILCLQEIKCHPNQLNLFESDALKDYEVFWNPAERPGYSGTATLIKKDAPCSLPQTPTLQTMTFAQQLQTHVADKYGSPASEGRILVLEFDKFYLVNVYTPNSKTDLSRLDLRHDSWDPEFLRLLESLEKSKPVVTCGDFNCAVEEIDLARPQTNHTHAGFTDAEREGVRKFLEAGFIDTFRNQHPDAARYSWWSHWGKARENNVGWRIDYFFISNSLRANLLDAEIYESVLGSDHCPISITLNFPESSTS